MADLLSSSTTEIWDRETGLVSEPFLWFQSRQIFGETHENEDSPTFFFLPTFLLLKSYFLFRMFGFHKLPSHFPLFQFVAIKAPSKVWVFSVEKKDRTCWLRNDVTWYVTYTMWHHFFYKKWLPQFSQSVIRETLNMQFSPDFIHAGFHCFCLSPKKFSRSCTNKSRWIDTSKVVFD